MRSDLDMKSGKEFKAIWTHLFYRFKNISFLIEYSPEFGIINPCGKSTVFKLIDPRF